MLEIGGGKNGYHELTGKVQGKISNNEGWEYKIRIKDWKNIKWNEDDEGGLLGEIAPCKLQACNWQIWYLERRFWWK